jgi:serine protease
VGLVDGNSRTRFPSAVGDSAARCRRAALVRWLVAGWVVCLSALAAAPAFAGTDPATLCARRQLSAATRLHQVSHVCWAHAYSNLRFDLSKCLVKAEAVFQSAYATAAQKAARSGGQCALRLDVNALLSVAAGDVDPVVSAVAGNVIIADPVDRKLRVKLMSAMASFSKRAFDAELEFTVRNDPNRLDERLALARSKLDQTFTAQIASAAAHGLLYDGISADDTSASLQQAASLWERLTRATNGAFSVSGTVFAAEDSFTDSDVNDVHTVAVSNDDLFAAQELPVPATVGGYLNQPQAGPDGNSFEGGDALDSYKVTKLKAGQVVALVLGDDPATSDLQLCVVGPSEPDAVCSSDDTKSVKTYVAPADDMYFIQVKAADFCNCSGTYTLSIGQTAPAAALHAERIDADFVPGELIVKLRPVATAAGGGVTARASALASDLGLVRAAGEASRPMLMRLPTGAARDATFQKLGVTAQRRSLQVQTVSDAAISKQETLLARRALRKRADVESVSLNTIVQPSVTPNDPYYGLQWHYPLIHLPEAWDITTGDPNVVVAVVDTGVRLDHPDLAGSFVAGYDFIQDPVRARDGNGIDPDPNDPGDKGAGAGSSFHGTHVAGTIAAATNNGIGVAGVSWGSKVMPVRVLGKGGGTMYDVMQGVAFAAGLPNDSGTVPAKKADVINLSLGGGGFDDAAQTLFNQVRAQGVIVVAAAGNQSTSAPSYPAAYDNVVSVAAVDLNRNPAPYSNFGSTVDVAAPGGDTSVDRNADTFADGVLSTLADDTVSPLTFGYVFYQGTSMATPHVSGVFALMRSVNPALTPASIDTMLASGMLTDDLLTPGFDPQTGWGLIDAQAAVIAAGGTPVGSGTPLAVSPATLNFGVALDTLDFGVSNVGTDPLTVTGVTVQNAGANPWLQVAAHGVDGSGLGTYRATVDRTGLPTDPNAPANYTATIDVSSSGGTAHVKVLMRVGGPTASDTGFQYVLLVDSQTLAAIDEVALPATNGTYPYAFQNVPQGDYLLISGSDMDDDLLICDGGEACGSYPTLDLPTPLTVDSNKAGIDFGVAFRQSIRSSEVSAASAVPPAGILRKARR